MSPFAERNREIVRRFEEGETLESIGVAYGITRERVRQITDRAGVIPRHQQAAERLAAMLNGLRNERMSAKDAEAHFGFHRCTIATLARKHGITLLRRSLEEQERLEYGVERVKAGESIRGVAAGDYNYEHRLAWYCRSHGIKSQARCRWRDLSYRKPLLRQWRMANLSWSQIQALMDEHEGVKSKGMNAYVWASEHCPDVLDIKVDIPRTARPHVVRKPRKPKPARVVAPDPDIVVLATVRETAVANRGKATASQIARALGTTRNAIIGHWFRSRQVA